MGSDPVDAPVSINPRRNRSTDRTPRNGRTRLLRPVRESWWQRRPSRRIGSGLSLVLTLSSGARRTVPVRRDRDLERTYSRAQFVAKLRRLADALEAGAPFNIQVANERLRIPADVAFNVEHERSGGVQELEFQLRWAAPED